MNRFIKYGLLVIVVAVLAYKSVYFEKLSTRKNDNTATAFDAGAFSKQLWVEQFPAQMDSAIQLTAFMDAIGKDAEAAINKHTHALAIGNYRYVLVKLDATVDDVREDEVLLNAPVSDSILHVNLATEFIYGNAIRDASGLVAVKDFPNTAELNSISEALNKIIRTEVLPAFKSAVKKGDMVHVVGAVELNKDHIHWQGLELLPLRLQIKQ